MKCMHDIKAQTFIQKDIAQGLANNIHSDII